MVSRFVLTVFLGSFLVACAPSPERPEKVYEPPQDREEQTPAAVAPAEPDSGVRRASDSLLVDAREARGEGALDRAEALLQRAQRIDPDNGRVYLELAELYVQRGQQAAAQSVAERGLLYCRGEECARLRRLAAN